MIYCKEVKGGSYYLPVGIGLTIDCETIGVRGYLRGWHLALATGERFNGATKEDLLATLKKLWPNFKWHTDSTRDKAVIFTDNIKKVLGFFYDHITDQFEDYTVTLDDFFDVRPCDRWFDENEALAIAKQAQVIIDTYFVPEKHFYITPQQRNRKHLQATKGEDDTAAKSYPLRYDKWKVIRKGYFSGLLYIPYCENEKDKQPTRPIEEPMLVLDITSSYIFDLLCEKHVISKGTRIRNLAMWEYYLTSATKISLGQYEISYATPRTFVSCYTDIDGNKLEAGEHTVKMVLTNIDLQNLLKLGYIKEVKPEWLYEYEAGTLPKYYLDALVDAYIAKATAKDEKEKAIRKPILNGFYGDTIRKYDTEEEFWETRVDPILSPLWGICTTAYAKKYLLKLALRVDGWYYSDTDSIICKDTPENRKHLENFNAEIMAMVKVFCEQNGYDYEKLKKLGTFKVEAEIVKLKVWACKTYCYKKIIREKDDNGEEKISYEVVLKAAGLVKNNIELNDKLFTLKELDYTRMVFPKIVQPKGDREGYYAEISPVNKAQYMMLMHEQLKAI